MKLDNAKLQLAMANACITITELSIQSGVARAALTRYAGGKANPKPITIGKIAKGLGIKVEELIEANAAATAKETD